MARTYSERSTLRSMTSRPTGTIIAPPMPCTTRASDQFEQIVAEAAEHRGEGEDADRRAEDGARAIAVGDPAARQRDEDREAQHVGGDAEAELHRVGAEGLRHRRQRRRDDGAGEGLHEEGAGDDERDDHRSAALGLPRAAPSPASWRAATTRPSHMSTPGRLKLRSW